MLTVPFIAMTSSAGALGFTTRSVVRPVRGFQAGGDFAFAKRCVAGAGHVTFYVAVPDLDAALNTIHGLGGSTMMPPADVPGGPRIAMFKDPEGHVVGLLQDESGASGWPAGDAADAYIDIIRYRQ